MSSIKEIQARLKSFVNERDWAQYHTPKNLSMALAVEASELLEKFQWLTEKESFQLSDNKHNEVEEEIADILIYLVRIADQLNVDLIEGKTSYELFSEIPSSANNFVPKQATCLGIFSIAL